MNQKMLKIVNAALALAIVSLVSSLLLQKVTDYSFPYAMHGYSGLAVLSFAAIHIFLNRSWVINTFFKRKK